jgi:hypothetical protein
MSVRFGLLDELDHVTLPSFMEAAHSSPNLPFVEISSPQTHYSSAMQGRHKDNLIPGL